MVRMGGMMCSSGTDGLTQSHRRAAREGCARRVVGSCARCPPVEIGLVQERESLRSSGGSGGSSGVRHSPRFLLQRQRL